MTPEAEMFEQIEALLSVQIGFAQLHVVTSKIVCASRGAAKYPDVPFVAVLDHHQSLSQNSLGTGKPSHSVDISYAPIKTLKLHKQ